MLTQLRQQAWQVQDGLPLNTVLTVNQGSDRSILVGTENGSARLDGVEFTPLALPESARPGAYHVQRIAVADDGTIALATYDGVFIGSTMSDLRRLGLGQIRVRDVSFTASGDILAITRGMGLYLLTRAGSVTNWRQIDGLASNDITAMAPDAAGVYWLGHSSGALQRFSLESGSPVSSAASNLSDRVEALLKDSANNLWVGTREGLFKLENNAVGNPTRIQDLNGQIIRSITQEESGGIWVATASSGIFRICEQDRIENLSPENGLAFNRIEEILHARDGSIWLASGGGGLIRLSEGIALTFDANQDLPDAPILPIMQSADGSMWIGSFGGGLARLRNDGEVERYLADNNQRANVLSLVESEPGQLWVGTTNGIYRWADGEFSPQSELNAALSSSTVGAMVYDRERQALWMASQAGLAVLRDGQVLNIPMDSSVLPGSLVSLHVDEDNTVWAGSEGGGLLIMDDGLLTQSPLQSAIESVSIYCLSRESSDILWICTRDGLYLWDGDGLYHLDTSRGLLENTVFSIIRDDYDFYWLSGNQGVYRVVETNLVDLIKTTQDIQVNWITEVDGMPARETNGGFQPAVWKDSLGYLWYPTSFGAGRVAPSRLTSGLTTPQPYIREISVDEVLLEEVAGYTVPAGGDTISFRFSAREFDNPESIEFQYRIEGVDRQWFSTTEGNAVYRGLDPGDYVFSLRARNKLSTWSESVSLPFQKDRFFYQYWLIQVAALILLFCSIVFIVIKRQQSLSLKRQRLQSSQKLESLGLLAGGIAHDFNNLLTGIFLTLDSARDFSGSNKPLKDCLDDLEENATRGAALVKQLLNFSQQESSENKSIDLASELDSLIPFLRKFVKTDVELKLLKEHGRFHSRISRPNLQQVVLNLVLNARDAIDGQGEIIIKIELIERNDVPLKKRLSVKNYARVSIKDTGSGIDKSTRRRMFDSFFTSKSKTGGTGIGLSTVKQIIEAENGFIQVESTPGEGSVFYIYLPVE